MASRKGGPAASDDQAGAKRPRLMDNSSETVATGMDDTTTEKVPEDLPQTQCEILQLRDENAILNSKISGQEEEIERLRMIVRNRHRLPQTVKCDQQTQVDQQTQTDEVTKLPEVPLVKILCYLPQRDRLTSASYVCRRFRDILQRPYANRAVVVRGRADALSRVRCVSLRHYLKRFASTIVFLKITTVTGFSGTVTLQHMLPSSMPRVTEIVLSRNDTLDHVAIAALARTCPNVSKFTMDAAVVNKRTVKVIRKEWAPKLTHLSVNASDAPTASLLKLYNALDSTSVTSFDMSTSMTWLGSFTIQPTLLMPYAGPALTTIRLDHVEVTDELVDHLTIVSPNISTLVIRETLSLTDHALKYIARLKRLNTLYLCGSDDFTVAGIKNLLFSPGISRQLKSLSLISFEHLNDAVVEAICESQPSLECCGIAMCSDVTEMGYVTLINGLTKLQFLRVSDSCFSTKLLRQPGIEHRLPALSILDVTGCAPDVGDLDAFATNRRRTASLNNAGHRNELWVIEEDVDEPIFQVMLFHGVSVMNCVPLRPLSSIDPADPLSEFEDSPPPLLPSELYDPYKNLETPADLMAVFGWNSRDLYTTDPF